jgi:CHAD domain-containing protein
MAHPSIDSYLATQLQVFQDIAHDAKGEPKRRQVHDLRVAARRLQAGLWLASQAQDELKLKKARQSLRRLLKRLSPRRELDVAIADAAQYDIDCKQLKKKRRKVTSDVTKYLTKGRRKRLGKRIRRAVERVHAADTLDLTRPVTKLRRELKEWMASPPQELEQYHDLRLSLKKARYALEALDRPATALKPLQEQLGRLHDLHVLRGYVGDHPAILQDEAIARAAADKVFGSAVAEALAHLSVMSGPVIETPESAGQSVH